MKLSSCLALLSLSAVSLSSPTSESTSKLKERSIFDWINNIFPGFSKGSQPQKASPATSYGFFNHPIIPPIKPPFPVSPVSQNSTSKDAQQNPWLPNSPNHRGNWAWGYDINTDTTTKWPTTGRTVRYTLTISNGTAAPDGVPKQMLLVNGQYPGPLIEANWGDYLEITVINNMKYNGTSMHWHGVRQLGTNLADGVAGGTECPIAPGDSKVYRFQATEYGSTWYHSHFSVQYGDGVLGPLVIHGPSSADYDIDLGAVLISDFYPLTAPQEDYFAHRQGPPQAKNYLINGQNIALDGSTGKRTHFQFVPGKKHLLRLINTSMDALFKMSIDGHTIQVIQADFVPIHPYNTNEVSMHLAQRYHIIVEANQKPGNYFFRAMAAKDCTNIANDGTGNANAIISYANAPNPNALPTSTATNHTNTCVDEPIASLVPIVQISVDSTNFVATARTEDVNIQVITQPEFVFQWTLGGVSAVLDWNNPTVVHAATGNNTYPGVENVIQLTQPNIWTFWIIQNEFFVPHPMHAHGHDFSLLGQGNGVFDPSTDMSQLNFQNPPRRDVALLVASGWTVIAFKTDNPGSWMLHCHIAWHAGEGLALSFMERPADIQKNYGAQVQGAEFQNTCKNWRNYAKTAVWPQYDSGLKRRDLVPDEEVVAGTREMLKLKKRASSLKKHSVVRRSF